MGLEVILSTVQHNECSFGLAINRKFHEINDKARLLRGGGGGGGGVHPDYFVKLDFEIAVDQQTRARDRTFEGVPDSG